MFEWDDMDAEAWENHFDPGIEYTDYDERYEEYDNIEYDHDPKEVNIGYSNTASANNHFQQNNNVKPSEVSFELKETLFGVKPVALLSVNKNRRVFLEKGKNDAGEEVILVLNINDRQLGCMSQEKSRKIIDIWEQNMKYKAIVSNIIKENNNEYIVEIVINGTYIPKEAIKQQITYESTPISTATPKTEQKTRKYGWGTLIGGIIGAAGGPIGALIGAIIGNQIDNWDTNSQIDQPARYNPPPISAHESVPASNYRASVVVTPQSIEHGQFYTKVVGVTFEGRQDLIRQLRPGEQLSLVRERYNPYDSNAIAVFDVRGRKIGYLGRELAAEVAPRMDRGWSYRAEVDRVTGGGDYNYGVNIRVDYYSR